jgi:hypothetical protein
MVIIIIIHLSGLACLLSNGDDANLAEWLID